MIRVQVSEATQPGLPPIDVGDAEFVIGSSPAARVRLPASAARPEHVRIALGAGGARWQTATERGVVGDGATFEIGPYRVRVAPAPAGTMPSPHARTESLARELARNILGGANAAPTLEIESGPFVGAKRPLAPPVSALVIGRGDDADWVVLDRDVSKRHAEIRHGWDGVRVVDLGSRNGTRVDRELVGPDGLELHDGARLDLGKLVVRYRDPAEAHLGAARRTSAAPVRRPRAPAGIYAAVAIAVLAIAALAWLFAG